MSVLVERLAAELASLVAEADGDLWAHEVRAWFEQTGRATPEQIYSAGRIAESRGWIERHGKYKRRLLWGVPQQVEETEGAA